MTRTPAALLAALSFLAFVSLGLPDGVAGVAWPSVRATYGLPVSHLGLLLAAGVTGYFLASFNSGTLVARLGIGGLLFWSSVFVVVGLIGYAVSPGWWVMVAFGLFTGLGSGAIDAGINAYAAHHFSPRSMTWLHACYGLGAMLGPLLMTAVLTTRGSWREGYALLAVLLAGMTAAFFFTRRWWESDGRSASPEAPGAAPEPPAGVGETLARPSVWLAVVFFFVYTGTEVAAGQWSYSLFVESPARRIAPATAGVWVGIYWGGLMAGRVVFGALANHVSPRLIVRVTSASLPVGALLLWLNPTPLVSFLGLALMGFMFAPIFPLMMSLTPARVGPRYATHAVGFQVAAATLGAAALPWAAGALAKRMGLEVIGPYLLVASLALPLLHELLVLATAGPRAAKSGVPGDAVPPAGTASDPI